MTQAERWLKILIDMPKGPFDSPEAEAIKYLLEKSIYIPKFLKGQRVFMVKRESNKNTTEEGFIRGFNYTFTDFNKDPEVWYLVEIKGTQEITILSEEEIYTGEDKKEVPKESRDININ